MTSLICNYCGNQAVLVTGRELYPRLQALADNRYYVCAPCGAQVGCHPGTDQPLGRLANADLRRARADAHAAFDPLWKSGQLTRSQAYHWLAEQLGLDSKACHIGEFDLSTCHQVIATCQAYALQLDDVTLRP